MTSPAASETGAEFAPLPERGNLQTCGLPVFTVGRWALVVWAGFLIAGFALAIRLEPDPRGFGTHQRLGLPPCSVRLWLGVPCPSCGGTTAFAWFVRGHWIAALQANPAAFGLALLSALMIPWSLYSAVIARLWRVQQPDLFLMWILGVFLAVSLVQWLVTLALTRWT